MSEAYLEPAQAFKMVLWDYPFNTYTKVFEKLIFLTPYICVSGVRNNSFLGTFAYELNV